MYQELTWARKWLSDKKKVVLAIVTSTWGSAPRPVGSLMVIHEDGHFEGSVSGGCVEGAVISEAEALIGSDQCKSLEFTVSSEDAWQVGLACGGRIQIQLYPLDFESVSALQDTLSCIDTRLSGALSFKKEKVSTAFTSVQGGGNASALITDGPDKLTLAVTPSPQLFVIGAVHISQALTPMALACGYQVTVIDPRGLFVENRHFEGATIVHDWPDEFFETAVLDQLSALVTLTHDPKIDDAALSHGLRSEAFYIGSLGSKKTHASRVERLKNQDFNEKDLARINGPIGLNIGSKSPAEIAVSIMAELTANYRGLHAV